MQSRQLGDSDVHVSPVIFGAWAIGGWMWGGTDDDAAVAAIQASIDAGVNTIDTAAIYGMGHSEEIVARAIKGRRDKVVIATKCGMRWDGDDHAEAWEKKVDRGKDPHVTRNAKKDSIAFECERSLKRLGVETIDLYQIHWPDNDTPIEESIQAMEKLRKEGKIRAIGVSNFDVPLMEKAKKAGPLSSLQPPYSLIQRNIEKEILPWCRQNNVGVIVYSPLERGLLTGKVGPDRKFNEGDHRAGHKFFTPENRKRVLDTLEKIKPIADKHKASFAQLVIAWTIAQPGITAALVGARDAEQAKHNAGAMSLKLSSDELGAVRAAFDETAKVMTS